MACSYSGSPYGRRGQLALISPFEGSKGNALILAENLNDHCDLSDDVAFGVKFSLQASFAILSLISGFRKSFIVRSGKNDITVDVGHVANEIDLACISIREFYLTPDQNWDSVYGSFMYS